MLRKFQISLNRPTFVFWYVNSSFEFQVSMINIFRVTYNEINKNVVWKIKDIERPVHNYGYILGYVIYN